MTGSPLPLFGAGADDRRVREARHIVTNPQRYANRPLLIQIAWATLKTAQGKPLRQRRADR